jgi:hypothetical protein
MKIYLVFNRQFHYLFSTMTHRSLYVFICIYVYIYIYLYLYIFICIWICNNQLDALFILSLLNYHISTCFGRISSPSSGGRMYIRVCGKWYLLYFWVDCPRAWLEWNRSSIPAKPGDNQLYSITSTICHILVYTSYLLMIGCWYADRHASDHR